MKNKTSYLTNNRIQIVILAILTLAICIRIKSQGDPRLSIANDDTLSYVSSSEVPLLSWGAFTGRRLFTTNLVYQLLKPDHGYKILVNGSSDTTKRRVQPSFVNVVLLQFFVSIIAWSVLTIAITNRLKNPIPKILGGLIIATFAFVPQIADWDSILTSESLSFSLLALQTGLLIDLAFRFTKDTRPTWPIFTLTTIWLAIVFFWTFLKDAHLYGIIVLAMMIAASLISGKFRKQGFIYMILLALAIFFLLGWSSSKNSARSQIQLTNVYKSDILSDPERVEFMRAYGMPLPESPVYASWFLASAQNAYFKYLLFHPGYVITNYFEDAPYAFFENVQTYFNTKPQFLLRKALLPIGDILHPENSIPILVDFLILMGILGLLFLFGIPEDMAWGWLATWMFLFANTNMFVNIFGDVNALPRHALIATTLFRLFMWVFPIVLIDLIITFRKKPKAFRWALHTPYDQSWKDFYSCT